MKLILVNLYSELRKVLFLALSMTFLFLRLFACVCEISGELLSIFAPNSQGRLVWSSLGRVWMSRSNVNVTRDKFPPQWKRARWKYVIQQQTGPFRRCPRVMGVHRQRRRSVIFVAAYVRFMFGKTSLASSFCATVRLMLSVRCLSVLSVTLVYYGQTVGWSRWNLACR